MTSGGVEAFKAAVRRSLLIIVGLIVLGIVAVNVFKQLQGPQYDASARVLISTTPLSSIITGTQPSFVDPARVQTTAVGIAGSPEVYALAAEDTDEEFGDAGDLEAATAVVAEPNSDLIVFTSSDEDPDTAVGMVNAVGAGYVQFRDQLGGDQIKSAVESLRSSIGSLPADSTDRAEQLEQQLQRLLVLQENSGDAQLIEEADDASQSSPAPLRDSLVGLSIGLVIALLVVGLREVIDTTVRTESDVEDLLSTQVLASVRSLPRRTRMVTYGRHQAMFADAYALLAAQLVQNGTHEKSTVLAVTSSVSREGKTTTAANLAVAIARRGTNVVLADFDFRKPALSEVFGLPKDAAGAIQVMEGKTSLDSALWSASLEGSRPRVSQNGSEPDAVDPQVNGEGALERSPGSLHLLTAGGVTRSAPQQSRLDALIGELEAGADVVILDTPPALLTVEVAELSKLIDMVVVVVRQGRVSQRNLRMLGRQARTWPAEMAGAVMTDVQTEGGKYSYYGS